MTMNPKRAAEGTLMMLLILNPAQVLNFWTTSRFSWAFGSGFPIGQRIGFFKKWINYSMSGNSDNMMSSNAPTFFSSEAPTRKLFGCLPGPDIVNHTAILLRKDVMCTTTHRDPKPRALAILKRPKSLPMMLPLGGNVDEPETIKRLYRLCNQTRFSSSKEI